MSLATLSLAVFLVLYAVVAFGWLAVSATVLGIFAFIAGVLFILEGTNTWTYSVGDKR